jgi:hypothetical protein
VCYSLIGKENNATQRGRQWLTHATQTRFAIGFSTGFAFNYNGVRSPRVWAEELGVKILDADGFEGVWLKSITLADFMERVQWATIQPKFFDKRG